MSSIKLVSSRSGAREWLFQRVSGVVLAVILAVHFLVLHFGASDAQTSAAILTRLSSPFWKVLDLTFLLLALGHSANGARILIDDYVRHASARTWLIALAWTTALVLALWGLVIIVNL